MFCFMFHGHLGNKPKMRLLSSLPLIKSHPKNSRSLWLAKSLPLVTIEEIFNSLKYFSRFCVALTGSLGIFGRKGNKLSEFH